MIIILRRVKMKRLNMRFEPSGKIGAKFFRRGRFHGRRKMGYGELGFRLLFVIKWIDDPNCLRSYNIIKKFNAPSENNFDSFFTLL